MFLLWSVQFVTCSINTAQSSKKSPHSVYLIIFYVSKMLNKLLSDMNAGKLGLDIFLSHVKNTAGDFFRVHRVHTNRKNVLEHFCGVWVEQAGGRAR